MRKILLTTAVILLLTVQMLAQNKTISGKITGIDGSPLVGVTVQAKGTNVYVQSGPDGSFTMKLVWPRSPVVSSSQAVPEDNAVDL